jgi:hypothetical protein
MKKLIVFIALAVFGISIACDNEKKTDNSKPYGSSDTSRTGSTNSAADSSRAGEESSISH